MSTMSLLIYQGFKVICAILHPAYSSYKAVKTKNAKEYVKWMMYWIVFAFFLVAETFTDICFYWLPFYCELKIILLLWILSPTTKGASIVYRKLLQPQISKREQDIDSCIEKASSHGYSSLRLLASRALSVTTDIILTSAVLGQNKLADRLQRSRSLDCSDLDQTDGGGAYDGSGVSNLRRLKSTEGFGSTTSLSDDVINSIIEESYRQQIIEKNKEN